MSGTDTIEVGSGDSALCFENPFDALAYLLFSVRYSLESTGGRTLPRWVRIARARKYAKAGEPVDASNFLAHGSRVITNGLAEGASGMVKLVIFLRELLEQADSMVAIAEVGLQLIKTAASPAFTNAVKNIYAQAPDLNNDAPPADNMNDFLPSFDAPGNSNSVTETIEKVEGWLRYVPTPEDLDRIGQELYYLLAIVQEDHIDSKPDMKAATDHIKIDSRETGKIRLMNWAFNEPTAVYGGEYENSIDLLEYGSRRVWNAANADLPPRSKESFENETKTIEIFDFDTSDNTDLSELASLLIALDYDHSWVKTGGGGKVADNLTLTGEFDADMKTALYEFQLVNNLDASGELDNATINRLLNLDYDKKNVLKALKRGDEAFREQADPEPIPPVKIFGEIELVNPDAEDYAKENRTLTGDPYKYYVINNSANQSWQQYTARTVDANTKFINGFVGLSSRKKLPAVTSDGGIFDGGKFSEGESSNGGFFFAARHTQPWRPGRTGHPNPSVYDPDDKNINDHRDNVSQAVISRMYQWVDISAFLTARFGEFDPGKIKFTASCRRRSLYTERDTTTGHRPDQGRIGLELYELGSTLTPNTDPDTVSSDIYNNQKTKTDWAPTKELADQLLSAQQLHQKNLWFATEGNSIEIAESAHNGSKKYYLLVYLDGLFRANYDIDAYFDEVKIKWNYVKD